MVRQQLFNTDMFCGRKSINQYGKSVTPEYKESSFFVVAVAAAAAVVAVVVAVVVVVGRGHICMHVCIHACMHAIRYLGAS